MPSEDFIRRSQVAIDWDIKQTPRFLYYMLVDSKSSFLEQKRARNGNNNPKLLAKYFSDLYMLYYSVQIYFDNYLLTLPEEENPNKIKPVDYEELAYEKAELSKVMKLDKLLCKWLFSEGPFKTDSEEKHYSDIADQLDDERAMF
jgi:hypothetical protein